MKTVEEYLEGLPEDIRHRISTLRTLVMESVPGATESISYGMPAYKFKNKPLIYFAAFPRHIGIYALPAAHKAFEGSLQLYKKGKGSFQVRHSQPIPLDLIRAMIEYNVHSIMAKN